MIACHRDSGAALTIGYQEIEPEYVKLFGMVELDAQRNLRSFVEKPAHPVSNTIFSAVCIFRSDILRKYLADLSATDWQFDISRDVIPAMLKNGERIKGFPFEDYWEDIGTVERYHRAQMALLGDAPTMRLADMPCTILPECARRYIRAERNIVNAIVSEDCTTLARIENAIIYPGVEIADSATVRNSVLFPGARVLRNVMVENEILIENQVAFQGSISSR
jgi:glucose-1-phosphate adenylyltransferase